MFTFNRRGNLIPPELVQTNWELFFNFFVKNSNNERRWLVGNQLFIFLTQIQDLLDEPFEVWIDGSFVTQKIEPNDVDILIHLPNHAFTNRKSSITHIIERVKYETGGLIDAYFTIKYAQNHKFNPLYEADLTEWKYIYGKTRPLPSGVKFPKGIISLNFDKNDSNN